MWSKFTPLYKRRARCISLYTGSGILSLPRCNAMVVQRRCLRRSGRSSEGHACLVCRQISSRSTRRRTFFPISLCSVCLFACLFCAGGERPGAVDADPGDKRETKKDTMKRRDDEELKQEDDRFPSAAQCPSLFTHWTHSAPWPLTLESAGH